VSGDDEQHGAPAQPVEGGAPVHVQLRHRPAPPFLVPSLRPERSGRYPPHSGSCRETPENWPIGCGRGCARAPDRVATGRSVRGGRSGSARPRRRRRPSCPAGG
jgi:hypothetical protein